MFRSSKITKQRNWIVTHWISIVESNREIDSSSVVDLDSKNLISDMPVSIVTYIANELIL